ncbi:MAG: outer membrane protein transport protein [Kofleriaceae bacterium]|nr:outer membrane protein transport protein [Kofleriaceae bacterium]
MRTLTKSLSQALFLVAGATGVASGNAFNINEHDAKVTGRGGASVATNIDASSVVFNPGGIPVSEGTQVVVNGSLYVAKGSYELVGTDEKITTTSPAQPVPSLFVTSRVHELVGVGLGVHFPFGLHVKWPGGHPQQAIIEDQTLRTYFITPAVGINLNKYVPGLSIGGGFDIVPATVELERAVVFGDVVGRAHLGGDAVGFGGRVGVLYRPEQLPQLSAGLMWRSKVNLDFEGEGDFDIPQPFRDQLPPDGDISTSISLPQSLTLGVSYTPIEKLNLEIDAVWINWSVFKELRINLPGGAETVAPQNYENKITVRVGGEYTINPEWAVRAGFIYDPTPIPPTTQTAQLPDVNRINVTAGATYSWGDGAYNASLGMLLVTPRQRDTSDEPYMPFFKGEYGVWALVTSVMVGGRFGQGALIKPSSGDATATTTMR